MIAEGAVPPVRSRVHIRAVSRWRGVGLRELWSYRELLYFLSKRELQVRYNQSVFGIAWAVVQPLAMAGVFALVFGHLFKVPSQGVPYGLFALVGFTAWMFVAQTVTGGGGSLVADAHLLTKVYFPRLILPLAKAAGLLVDLAVAVVVVIVIAAATGRAPAPELLTLPAWVALLALPAVALGMLAGATNVRYRDVAAVLPLLVQIWLFLTPVTYPVTLVPGGAWHYVYAINPAASATTGLRWSLLHTAPPSLAELAISTAVSVALLVAAVVYFRRSEQTFADVI